MTKHATEALEEFLKKEEEVLLDLESRVEGALAALETSKLRVEEKSRQVSELKEAISKLEE